MTAITYFGELNGLGRAELRSRLDRLASHAEGEEAKVRTAESRQREP